MQLFLYQWGRTYKSVFEMPPKERPARHIIDDDFKFDNWLRREEERALSKDGKQDAHIPMYNDKAPPT